MLKLAIFGADDSLIHPEIKKISTSIDLQSYDVEKMLDPLENTPDVIICYSPSLDVGISTLEIAQAFRTNYPELPILFVALDKKDFDKKKLIKNGFSQAFLMPWEKSDMIRAMRDEALYLIQPELRDYKAIKVVDLIPGTVLDFSLKIYLPLSNKLLHFSHAGDPVKEERHQKLLESNHNTIFVNKDEVDKFQKYTANVLKKYLKPGAISETEKQERLETCVRDLISDMFIVDTRENTFGKSQQLLQEVRAIIKIMIDESNQDLAFKLNQLINQENNFYLHLSNVSTYAGLFAIVLGIENPEEIALAGLLHDIGKINLPQEIADLEEDELGPNFLEAYREHPKYTLDIVRLKKMVLPDATMKAILQHHEAMNGTGYPSGLAGPRISMGGRILAIADTFDYLTTIKPGRKTYTPREALEHLYKENTKDPGKMILDTDILKKLREVFIK